jgi:hypothetical protein
MLIKFSLKVLVHNYLYYTISSTLYILETFVVCFISSTDLKVSTCFFHRDSIEVVIRHDGPADVKSKEFLRHLADLLQIPDRYIHVSKLAQPVKLIRTSRVRPCPGNLLFNSYNDVIWNSTLGPYLVDSNGKLRQPNINVLILKFI